eukprot:1149675-Pelagomonas_calceolata.AAC.2
MKYLVINTAKLEVVHFNSSGLNLPVCLVGGVPLPMALAHKESFKYPGMWSHKHISMDKSSELVTGLSMAFAYRIWQFVRKHALRNRPHVPLWFGKYIWSQLACMQARCGAQSVLRKANNFQANCKCAM